MLKYFFATWLFSLLISATNAQSTFSVKIINAENQPISGATIYLGNLSQSTNSTGNAIFNNLTSSTYQIRVSHLGYEQHTGQVNVNQGTITITLKHAVRQTGEVFVYATRARENAATTFKNVNKEDIRKTNLGQDIPFLLDQTPGVVVSSDAGAGVGYTNMTIRGSDAQRVNVTLNGVPLNDAESMGSFFVNLPDFASSTESIQIQRGIGTSTNGAGAFGASLNIQTDGLETNPYAELNNSFGSFNTLKNTVKVGTGLIHDKYAFNARLSRIASDGYIERASSNLKSFYLDGGLYTEKHILKATIFSGKQQTYQAWYGAPEPLLKGDQSALDDYAGAMGLKGSDKERLLNADRRYNYYTYDGQTDNYTQTHSHLHYTYALNEKLSLNTALHYTRGSGYFEEFRKNDDLSDYDIAPVVINDDTISTSSDLIRRRWLDNHFYGGTFSLNYNPSNTLRFTWGGAYHQYVGDHYGEVIWSRFASNSNLGDRYYLNDAKKGDFNTYAKMDYRLEKWLFNVDLQYRNVNYHGKGPDDEMINDSTRRVLDFRDNLHFFNPKFGTTYFLNDHSNLYLSYAYASKEPIRKDYVENPLNEFPRPERMQNIEAGYRFKNQLFNLGLNMYGMFYKDQLIQTGAINDVGSALRQNVPDSYRIGIELDGAWEISSQFTWRATAALSSNKIRNFKEYVQVYNEDWDLVGLHENTYEKTNIAMSASTILSNDFTYRPMEPLSFSLTSKYVSRMYLDNTSSVARSIDPSFVNNVRAMYTFRALGLERIDLNVAINNIFNEKFETNGYTWGSMDSEGNRNFYNFYFPQATTNFLVGLNIRF